MNIIDLHTHSIYSDGTLSPAEIIGLAAHKHLKAVALTDHDTTDGLKEARHHAAKTGVEFISGVELSVDYNESELHILGLFIDENHSVLKDLLNAMKLTRIHRNKKMALLMQESGIDLTYDELVALAGGGAVITRAHFARLLVQKGYARDNNDAFRRFISKDAAVYVKRALFNAGEAIAAINGAGGVSILAHPAQYGFDFQEIHNALTALKNLGLQGIEAVYTTHTPSEEALYKRLAAQYGLKISGGSDFHGANKPDISLGTGFGKLKVPYDILDALRPDAH